MLKININYTRPETPKKHTVKHTLTGVKLKEGERGRERKRRDKKTLLKFVLLQTFNDICVFVLTNVAGLLCFVFSNEGKEGGDKIKEKLGEEKWKKNGQEHKHTARVVYSVMRGKRRLQRV